MKKLLKTRNVFLFGRLKGIQRIFKLDRHNAITRSSCDQVQLYMIRSDLSTFTRVIDQIKLICKSQTSSWSEDTNLKYFHIICLPTCCAYFPQLLEQQGLYGIVGLHRYNWDFIHLDEGVLSMEMPSVSFFFKICIGKRVTQFERVFFSRIICVNSNL